jgi:hypothetical protein
MRIGVADEQQRLVEQQTRGPRRRAAAEARQDGFRRQRLHRKEQESPAEDRERKQESSHVQCRDSSIRVFGADRPTPSRERQQRARDRLGVELGRVVRGGQRQVGHLDAQRTQCGQRSSPASRCTVRAMMRAQEPMS